MNTDTPRTDEQINGKPCTRFAVCAGDSLRYALVPSEFARQLERENIRLRAALENVEQWKLPPSGKNWEGGGPMSYGAAFGSNGERDYMRGIAREALANNSGQTDAPKS